MLNKYFLLLTILLFSSCNQNRTTKVVLIFSPSFSVVNDSIILDSIVITKYNEHITIHQFRDINNFLELQFEKRNGIFYEIRKHFIFDKTEKIYITLSDTIPVFCVRDTLFDYVSNRNFYHSLMDFSLGTAQYHINKINENTIISTRNSTIEHYQESYYYDKQFSIYRYIVKYKNSIIVYE